jgi:hypothetical protein
MKLVSKNDLHITHHVGIIDGGVWALHVFMLPHYVFCDLKLT